MVKVENISYAYPRAGKQVLKQVGFHLEEGECLAVLGNNGAGKSTLLKCIDRIYPTRGGVVEIDGQNMLCLSSQDIARNVAYVPQSTGEVQMTVFDAVMLGRKPYIKWGAVQEDREMVQSIIHRLELDDYALRNVAELSGGERQKVMLARALAQEPTLLLLDEPTSNLDPYNQHHVLQTVRMIARERRICVVTVLHDLNLAIRYCDRFLFLKESGVFAFGGQEIMTPENIEAVYNMHVHIIEHMGVPVVVPFPDVKANSYITSNCTVGGKT